MRMILHTVPHDIGDFDEFAIIVLMQGPEDAPLHGFSIRQRDWESLDPG